MNIHSTQIFNLDHIQKMTRNTKQQTNFTGFKASVWEDVKGLTLNQEIAKDLMTMSVKQYRTSLHQISAQEPFRYKTRVSDGVFYVRRIS